MTRIWPTRRGFIATRARPASCRTPTSAWATIGACRNPTRSSDSAICEVFPGNGLAARRRIAARYDAAFGRGGNAADNLGLRPVATPKGCVPNYYKYVVMLPDGVDRAGLKAWLREAHGVNCSGEVYEVPLHKNEVLKHPRSRRSYRRRGRLRPAAVPAGLRKHDRCPGGSGDRGFQGRETRKAVL